MRNQMTGKGLQTGPELLSVVLAGIKTPVLALAVLALATIGQAGIIDGPDGVDPLGATVEVTISGKVPGPVAIQIPFEMNANCSFGQLDQCWRDCQADAAAGNKILVRASCTATGGTGMICGCVEIVPGPYHPPIYWSGFNSTMGGLGF